MENLKQFLHSYGDCGNETTRLK